MTDEFPETAAVYARWTHLAHGFAAYSEDCARWSRATDDLLLDGLARHMPSRILDLACGAGEPTLRLAAHYPQARVVGVDFVAELLEALQRRARAANLRNVETLEANMMQLPIPECSFDTLTMRFGLAYYDDAIKLRILTEAARVLTPGGVVAIVDWGVDGHGPFRSGYMDILQQYEETAHANDRATSFALNSDAEFAALLREAGFREVQHGYPEISWNWPGPAETLWQYIVAISPELKQVITDLKSELRCEIEQRVLENLARYETESGMRMPLRNLLVTGVA